MTTSDSPHFPELNASRSPRQTPSTFSRIRRPLIVLALLLLAVGGLVNAYVWLAWRPQASMGAEGLKHLEALALTTDLNRQSPWWMYRCLTPYVYPPLIYALGYAWEQASGVFSGSSALFSLFLLLPLNTFFLYQLGRRLTRPAEALCLALWGNFFYSLALMKAGYLLDFPVMIWINGSLWCLLASRHFQKRSYSLGLGFMVGLGFLTKFTFPVCLAGACFGEFIYILWRGLRSSQPRHNFRLGRAFLNMGLALTIATALAMPWYKDNLDNIGHYLTIQRRLSGELGYENGSISFENVVLGHTPTAIIQRIPIYGYAFLPYLPYRLPYLLPLAGIVAALFWKKARSYPALLISLNILLTLNICAWDESCDQRATYPLLSLYALASLWYWHRLPKLARHFLLVLAVISGLWISLQWVLPLTSPAKLECFRGLPSAPLTAPVNLQQISWSRFPRLSHEKLAQKLSGLHKQGYSLIFCAPPPHLLSQADPHDPFTFDSPRTATDTRQTEALESRRFRLCLRPLLAELHLLLPGDTPIMLICSQQRLNSTLKEIQDDVYSLRLTPLPISPLPEASCLLERGNNAYCRQLSQNLLSDISGPDVKYPWALCADTFCSGRASPQDYPPQRLHSLQCTEGETSSYTAVVSMTPYFHLDVYSLYLPANKCKQVH